MKTSKQIFNSGKDKSRHRIADGHQKIVLLGDSGVGKTALTRGLIGGDRGFVPTESTQGLTETPFGSGHHLSIIDFRGNESITEIKHILKQKEPTIALVVVDMLRTEDLGASIEKWIEFIPTQKQENGIIKRFLVGSRCDRGSCSKTDLEALGKCYDFSGTFLTSALDQAGIHELRESVIAAAREQEAEPDGEFSNVAIIVRQLAEHLCELIAKYPNALEEVEWRDLERIIATALEEVGFSVELTRPGKDGGKDVIATCVVENSNMTFYVEIKHWRRGGRPGMQMISDFVEVNASDGTNGGLFLSSSGYAEAVYSRLSEISRQKVRLGERDKIVSLCREYVKVKRGLWSPLRPLPDVLFETTLGDQDSEG